MQVGILGSTRREIYRSCQDTFYFLFFRTVFFLALPFFCTTSRVDVRESRERLREYLEGGAQYLSSNDTRGGGALGRPGIMTRHPMHGNKIEHE